MITINLVEGFLHFQTSAFELYLYQWQTVDKNCYIISVFIFASHRSLVRYLVLVLTPMLAVQQFYVLCIAIVQSYQQFAP